MAKFKPSYADNGPNILISMIEWLLSSKDEGISDITSTVVKENSILRRKVVQRVLLAAVVLGIVTSILRLTLALYGVVNIFVISVRPPTQSAPWFITLIPSSIFAISPYVFVLGALSAFFMYIYFPMKRAGVF